MKNPIVNQKKAVQLAQKYFITNNLEKKYDISIPFFIMDMGSNWVIHFRLKVDMKPATGAVSVNKKTGRVEWVLLK